jgi:3-hydroxyacyl-[acyl-carrier-protein] dehydratase
MQPEEIPALVKRLRRAPLLVAGTGTAVAFDSAAVERLIPHRDPMRLLDAVDAVDLATLTVQGRRRLSEHDPMFVGHFPGQPVYPGVLVVEAIGQLALTLVHFSRGELTLPEPGGRMNVRATRIHHAAFFAPFAPGDTMMLYAQVLASDICLTAMGQAYNGGTLAACAISEVYLDD